jgi:hypothetical protein
MCRFPSFGLEGVLDILHNSGVVLCDIFLVVSEFKENPNVLFVCDPVDMTLHFL